MTRSYISRAFRFAPSPNGYLHLGHGFSALLNHEMALGTGGKLLLRIEDIDLERCRPEFEQAIYEDLAWLGLKWEQPVRRQSEHFDAYREALASLEKRGLVYPCFCSRADVVTATSERADWPRDPDDSPLYPGTCRHLSRAERQRRLDAGQPAAWRLDIARALKSCAGRSTGANMAAAASRASSRRSLPFGAIPFSPARMCRRAITSPSSSTTRCRV